MNDVYPDRSVGERIIALNHGSLSEGEIAHLADIGCEGITIPCIMDQCVPVPGTVEIGEVLRQAEAAWGRNLLTVIACPVWPAPTWMRRSELPTAGGMGRSIGVTLRWTKLTISWRTCTTLGSSRR